MRLAFHHLLLMALAALLGSGGCTGSKLGAAPPSAAVSQQDNSDRKPVPNDGIPPDRLDVILREHYRGLGFIERYDYEHAAEAFRKVHELAPQWIPGSINLAIALMHDPGIRLGREGLEVQEPREALDLLNEVMVRDLRNPHVRFCRGILFDSMGLTRRAHAEFRAVVEIDPNDAHAWYMLGSTMFVPEPGSVEQAKEQKGIDLEAIQRKLIEQASYFQKALQCNYYLSAAVYKLGLVQTRVTLGGVKRWATLAGRSCSAIIYGRNNAAVHRKKCYPGSERLEPGHKLAMVQRLGGDRAATKRLIDLWKRLDGGPGGIRVGEETSRFYGDQGRYAQVINPFVDPTAPASPIRLPRFDLPAPLQIRLPEGDRWVSSADFTGRLAVIGRARARFGAPSAAFDADGDGRTDLFLPAAIVGRQGVRDALLLNRGEGSFEDATHRLGFPSDRASLGAAAGDVDGDGRVDLFLTGVGETRLYRNEGSKRFKDVTKAAGVSCPPALSLTARWLDLDQDGDLDLYVVNHTSLEHLDQAFTEQTPPGIANAAYRNDGEPAPVAGLPASDWAPPAVARYPERASSGMSIKLTPWTSSDALLGGDAPHTGLALLDLDDDRDLDLVLVAEGAAPQAILHDRLGRFRSVSIPGLEPRVADAGLLTVEVDKDGRPDLVAVDAAGRVTAWRNQSRRSGADLTIAFERWPTSAKGWRGAQAADIDLDGWPDLLGLPPFQGLPIPVWARNEGRRLSAMTLPLGPDDSGARPLQAMAVVDLVGDALPDLVLIKDGDIPRLARNLGNGHHWLALRLSGRWASGFGRLRSNPHGIGARIWLQGPELNVLHYATTPAAGLAHSEVAITLGLGQSDSAAVARILWPDGVNQCELNVPADQVLNLVETTHRHSSCPILFAWDGDRYQCVGDLLDGGGLGYYLAPGVWSEPDRDEAVAIGAGQLRPSAGAYRLIITEPMDEVAYLDHLTLEVVDRPPGVATAPDERFATGEPRPTGQLIAWKTSLSPARSTDLAGNDLTETLRSWDRRTADGFKRREGWNGYAEEHGIVLDFGARLARFSPSDPLILCLAGWVEFPFSQTNYAAATAGISLQLPALERQQEDGSWKVIEANPGCPSGLPKLTTLDLTGSSSAHDASSGCGPTWSATGIKPSWRSARPNPAFA
jgi:hypothetical protein